MRHYTSLGMLDEPLRAGREARYTVRHLLQLLVLRRLLAEGHGASALGDLARRKSDAELLAMLEGGVDFTARETPALNYLAELRRQYTRSPLVAYDAPPPPPPPLLRWHRFEIAPGLELHVREDFQLPKTTSETEALFQEIRRQLMSVKPRRR